MDYNETEVDFHLKTEHPTTAFVKWILYDLPTEYETFAFAHNGIFF
jgi:hypothetical protein